MSNSIQYPASAKKADLVDIFNQRLKPNARKLLAARERVRRTSTGITNIPSSQDSSTVDGDDDDEGGSIPPHNVLDTPRHQKTRRVGHQGQQDSKPMALNTSQAPTVKRSSGKHSRQSNADPEPELPRPVVLKSRKSESTAIIKQEQSNHPSARPIKAESAFSDENPFQSGSSPSEMEVNRRHSGVPTKERRKSSSKRGYTC